MLRFILKRTEKDACSGYEGVSHETVDIDVPELEALLKRGGYGQSGYDYTEIAGVQFLPGAPDKMLEAVGLLKKVYDHGEDLGLHKKIEAFLSAHPLLSPDGSGLSNADTQQRKPHDTGRWEG